jgi:hypothetical protein
MRLSSLLVTCFFFFGSLSAQHFTDISGQQFVDVFHDKMYIWTGQGTIFQIDPDLYVKTFSVHLPKGVKSADKMRPKIRFDRLWVGNGEKIWSKPLEPSTDNTWELMKLPGKPGELTEFKDFEIISDKEAIICGAMWYATSLDSLSLDIHFIFNYKTGAIIKTIESFDTTLLQEALKAGKMTSSLSFNIRRIQNSYLCRFGINSLIVGKHSGFVTILDTGTGRTRKIEVVPEEELPSMSKGVKYILPAIAWVGPLSGDDVLICCRKWAPLTDNPSESVSAFVFRTLDLKTGKVKLHGSEYREKQAEWQHTLFEDNGELVSVSDFINRVSK